MAGHVATRETGRRQLRLVQQQRDAAEDAAAAAHRQATGLAYRLGQLEAKLRQAEAEATHLRASAPSAQLTDAQAAASMLLRLEAPPPSDLQAVQPRALAAAAATAAAGLDVARAGERGAGGAAERRQEVVRELEARLQAADLQRQREAEAHVAATAQCQQAAAAQARALADLERLVRQLLALH